MALNFAEVLHDLIHFARVYKWTLADDETGEAVVVPTKADVSVQAYGTWNGATLTVEGNLIPDNTINQFFDAVNPQGNLISMTDDGGDVILPNFYRMRPKITGGTGSSINIFVLVK